MLFLDGVYVTRCHDGDTSDNSHQVFRRVNAPTRADLEAVLQQLSSRLARMLVKEGVLTQDSENSYLTLDHLDVEPMQQVHGHSITYRIAIGPQQGKKVFTLQTLLPKATEDDRFTQVPNPRVNLTRFHGIFAPNSNYRVTITPTKRGKGQVQHRHHCMRKV